MQNKRQPRFGLVAGLMAGFLILAGCTDVFQEPQAQSSTGEGRVTITIDGGARTVLPSGAQFSRFEVTITEQGGTKELEPVEAAGGSAELFLPLGAWDVQVWAYNQAEPVAIVAQAVNTLTNTAGEITGNTRFVLEPTGTKPGVLAYRITKPEGSVLDGDQSRIQIEQNGIALKTIGFSDSVTGETTLEPGRYIVDILLAEGTNDKQQAAQRETVVILPGLTTEVNFAPAEFLAAMDILTFSSIAEYRATVEALPENTKDTPYRIILSGIALEDLWEGHDPLGQVFSVPGNKWIALDLSGCTGTVIGSLDDPAHMDPSFNPLVDPRPIGGTQDKGSIDSNLRNRGRVVSLVLPESLEIIGDFTFYCFSSLESVVLPESLKVIGHWGFQGVGLSSVELPDSVERIGIGAFRGSTLKSVKLSASLKEIPRQAFTAQPISSIELPQGLEVIGYCAFTGTALRSIHFPDTLTTIEQSAFTFTKQLESVSLPASLTTLEGGHTFRLSGAKSVDFSTCVNLETIGAWTFDECISLTKVLLPPNLKTIGEGAFMDCGQLQVLDLPPSVEVIEAMALNGGVRTLIVRSIEPPRVNTNKDFFNLSASVIYVPDESMEQYQAALGWSKHTERLRPLSEYPG